MVDADSTVDIGDPEMVVESIASLLADGDLERGTRFGNRTYVLTVYIEGPTLGELANAEASLRNELRKPDLLLTHDPGDSLTPPSVYEVLTARLSPERRDDHESHLIRKFSVTLTCAPFAAAASATTVDALTVGASSEVVVDTCDSTTGWTATNNGAPGTVDPAWLGSSGRLYTYDLSTPGPQTLTLKRTGTIDVTGRPYIRVNVHANEPEQTTATATSGASSFPLDLVSSRKSPASSLEYEFVFLVPTGITSLSSLTVSNYSVADASAFGISEVAKSGKPPGTIANKQTTRVIEVGGTERTPASIHVAAPDGSSDLGLAIVSTFPGKYAAVGFDPAMSRWYTSGTRTPDATTVSGYRFKLDNGFFESTAPASTFPDGGYQMVALASASTAGTYMVTSIVQTKMGGTILAEWINDEYVTLGVSPNWILCDLGVPRLPIHSTYSGADVVLAIKVRNVNGTELTGGVIAEAQDAWMFPVDDDCGLTAVLTDRAHLWLDSPTASSGKPRLWEGDSADRSGARFPLRLHTFGTHILTPGTTGMTAITTGVQNAPVTAEYRKRWLHNAAEEG